MRKPLRGRKGEAQYLRRSTNVYADLGFRAPGDMLLKAKLVSKIADLSAERGLTQSKAAVVLGIPQPKLSIRSIRGLQAV
ncbi:MAG: helix-turn-helix domain-containing protein [Steroidobacteraceae bacterium]